MIDPLSLPYRNVWIFRGDDTIQAVGGTLQTVLANARGDPWRDIPAGVDPYAPLAPDHLPEPTYTADELDWLAAQT